MCMLLCPAVLSALSSSAASGDVCEVCMFQRISVVAQRFNSFARPPQLVLKDAQRE